MRKRFTFCILLFGTIVSSAQMPINKAATDAFLISRMAEKFHVQPKSVNKELSAAWFDQLIKQLDEEKIFFTQDDIVKLQPYRSQLDIELLNKKTVFLQLLVSTYQQRLQMADSMIDNICKQAFRFTIDEKLTVAEDTSYPSNTSTQRIKLYKLLKAATLYRLLEWDEQAVLLKPDQKKKSTDSLEIVARKKIRNNYKRVINRMLQSPGGLVQVVSTDYCKALAVCYDPHSEFFPLSEKENFEGQLGNSSMKFGFQLNQNDNGELVIENLKPGSAAFKSGQLNKGDILQAVQWEGKESIDLSEASPREINEIFDVSNHDKLTLTIKKADGTIIHVGLMKEKSEPGDDDNRVKSFVLKGDKTVGYISLPAFYTDWESNGNGVNGCSDDVAKEIIKLKKESIDGLILDIRYNGGGSMEEAVDLAGIFIDAGPVAQVKSRDEKVFTYKDANRGTIYDGPLILMVNGYSASASEVIAGTLQDYNRALIVGSATYGKATAQVILPLDTSINFNSDLQNIKVDSYLKLTIQKLFRISGNSAQATGVKPDIMLQDFLEADPHREADAPFAFPTSNIAANKYYKAGAALPVASLQSFAKAQTDTSSYFKTLKSFIQVYKQEQQPRDIPLSWSAASQEMKKEKADISDSPKPDNVTAPFSVKNHAYEEQRLKTDSALRELDESWKKRLLEDPYVQISFGLLTRFK